MGDQTYPSAKFRWEITAFTRLTARKLYSDTFTVSGAKWRILVFPKGNHTDHLSIYLDVPDSKTLPTGWTREAKFSLSLVHQRINFLTLTRDKETGIRAIYHTNLLPILRNPNMNHSVQSVETQHKFHSERSDWGYTSFIELSDLHKISRGFLLDDTVVIEAYVEVHSIHPPIITTPHQAPTSSAPTNFQPTASTDRFDAFFASLGEFITDSSISTTKPGSSSENILDLDSKVPNLEEVEQAKKSLKECLSDLFKLNMKEKLAEALLTLSLAQDGLTPDQQNTVIAFWANFDEFTSDFLTFEQDNSEYELQKLLKDKMFATIKKNHETHLLYKQSLSDLSKGEEELKKRLEELKKSLEEVKTRRATLMLDWESLLAASEEVKSKYKIQEKKIADAEEKKRIAEERMSRSTTAWANLKKQFG